MRTRMLLLSAVVCLIGVTASNVGAQPGAGKKPKPAGATPMRWEYRVEYSSTITKLGEDLQAALNKLGADGWELVALEPSSQGRSGTYIFRRPGVGQPKLAAKSAPEPAPNEKAESKLELRLYSMKNASAIEMAQLLDEVLRINKYPMKIVAETRTNQVIVNGTADAHTAVEALLQRLDVPAANDAPTGGGPPPLGKKKKK